MNRPNSPHQQGQPTEPPGADDRTKAQIAIDVATSAAYGLLIGVEAEFDGDMAFTARAIVGTLDKFLGEVAEPENGGPEMAHKYAVRIAAGLRKHMLTRPVAG